MTGEDTYNPSTEPSIPYELNKATQTLSSQTQDSGSIPLPKVTPSNLPLGGGGGGGGQQPNYQLAQALNLFNKGGIVSAKKNF